MPANIPITQPYWLREQPTKGDYIEDSLQLVGKPENPPPLNAVFTLNANGIELPFEIPVLYRWTDPVKGEKYRSIEITPPVTISFEDPVYLFHNNDERKINIAVKAHEDNAAGTLKLKIPIRMEN